MKIKTFLCFITGILFFSCNEGTPPEMLTKAPYDINVKGRISTEYGYHYIKITKPVLTGEAKYTKGGDYTFFVSEIVEEPVEDAIVSLSDGNNIIELELFTDTGFWANYKGYYRTKVKTSGVTGKIYTLKINYNGKLYTASDSLAKVEDFEFNEISSFFPTFQRITDNQISFKRVINAFGFKKSNYWKWNRGNSELDVPNFDIAKYDIYISDYFYSHIGLPIQATFTNNSTTYGYSFYEDDIILISKYSMSEKYYKYIYAQFSETDWKSTIFSVIPGKIPTNLSEGGVGFFHATDVKRKSISGKEFTDLILKNN